MDVTSTLTGFHEGNSILVEIEFGDAVFFPYGWRAAREFGEKPSEQGENYQENQLAPDGNQTCPGHINGMRTLSPLPNPKLLI